jgi:hypothetical protein
MYESLAQVNLSAYRGRIETSGGKGAPPPSHRIVTVEGYLAALYSKVQRGSALTTLTSYVDCNQRSIRAPAFGEGYLVFDTTATTTVISRRNRISRCSPTKAVEVCHFSTSVTREVDATEICYK